METKISEIPQGWHLPRFTFGQQVQLMDGISGIIVGLEYAMQDSYLAQRIEHGWHYIIRVPQNYYAQFEDEEKRAKEADLKLVEQG